MYANKTQKNSLMEHLCSLNFEVYCHTWKSPGGQILQGTMASEVANLLHPIPPSCTTLSMPLFFFFSSNTLNNLACTPGWKPLVWMKNRAALHLWLFTSGWKKPNEQAICCWSVVTALSVKKKSNVTKLFPDRYKNAFQHEWVQSVQYGSFSYHLFVEDKPITC